MCLLYESPIELFSPRDICAVGDGPGPSIALKEKLPVQKNVPAHHSLLVSHAASEGRALSTGGYVAPGVPNVFAASSTIDRGMPPTATLQQSMPGATLGVRPVCVWVLSESLPMPYQEGSQRVLAQIFRCDGIVSIYRTSTVGK